MKTHLLTLLVLSFLFSCNSTTKNPDLDTELFIYQPKDREILEQVLELYSEDKEATTSALMVKVGSYFLETPYFAHTLEMGEEQLVVNLREMDCTTFAENCLAISRTIKSDKHTFEQFCSELQFIRYRDGIIDAYPSRLHYFCDWIFNNAQKNLIGDLSEGIAQTPFPKQINFMSTHPDSYRQLKESAALVDLIAAQEKLISARPMFYIPETKVAVSEITLEEYLLNNKSASGIMLARPI